MNLLMICFNCYAEFHPTRSKSLCPNCGFCYLCRDFTCFHHDINNGEQKRYYQLNSNEKLILLNGNAKSTSKKRVRVGQLVT